MKLLLITILFVSIITAGCSDVNVYTVKKDRVDQAMRGNRGYIMGTPPPAPITGEVPKRTMINVDIEIPVLPFEKIKTTKSPRRVITKEETVVIDEKPGETDIYVEEEVIEQEWIK